MKHLQKHLLACPLSLLCCLPVFAETVYKSIDDSGVVSFSDTPPVDDILVETVVIETPAAPSSDLTAQRLEDMRETTDRMVADRMAREKHRAELRQLDAQRYAETSQPDVTEYDDATSSYPEYYPYPVRRGWRQHKRPVHPIARPPALSPAPYQQPDYNYPASLIRKSYDPNVRAALR
ncbi:Uncharacterised protein [Halioglobus japonicus]|nr:Uncharacterised protein [Halioglobus japonicus]